MALEKPLKDFLNNFQKDLGALQKTLKKESDDLVKKVRTAASNGKIQARRKDLETAVEKQLKKFEPTINKFVHELSKSAKKAGVDLTQLEKSVRSNLAAARAKLSHAEHAKKTRTGAKKTGARRASSTKAPAKRAVKAPAAKVVDAPLFAEAAQSSPQ